MNSNNQITTLNLKEIIAKEPDNATFDFANQLAKSLSNIGLNSPQQTKAFKDLSILLTSDIKINSPIVVPLICGLGKTTFRTSYLISIINAIKHGIFAADKMHIIITADRIADLHKIADAVQKSCGYYYNDIPYVYVCHSWNKNNKCPNNVNSYAESLLTCNSENCKHYADNVCALANQLENQKKSPILAITNEKLGILLNQDKSEDGINQYCKFVDEDGVMHKRGMY